MCRLEWKQTKDNDLKDCSKEGFHGKLCLKPYWGNLTVRDFREGDGTIGGVKPCGCAIALLDILLLTPIVVMDFGLIYSIAVK